MAVLTAPIPPNADHSIPLPRRVTAVIAGTCLRDELRRDLGSPNVVIHYHKMPPPHPARAARAGSPRDARSSRAKPRGRSLSLYSFGDTESNLHLSRCLIQPGERRCPFGTHRWEALALLEDDLHRDGTACTLNSAENFRLDNVIASLSVHCKKMLSQLSHFWGPLR